MTKKSAIKIKEDFEKNGLDVGNCKTIAKKLQFEKASKKAHLRNNHTANMKAKKVVKEFVKKGSVTDAAKSLKISKAQVSKYLNKETSQKLLKESFEKAGLDKDSIAEIAKEFIQYNKEKIKLLKENNCEVEQMRDGHLAFKALTMAAKYVEPEKSTVDINHNHNHNIDATTAKLAIINLIDKLDQDDLKEIQIKLDNRQDQLMKSIN